MSYQGWARCSFIMNICECVCACVLACVRVHAGREVGYNLIHTFFFQIVWIRTLALYIALYTFSFRILIWTQIPSVYFENFCGTRAALTLLFLGSHIILKSWLVCVCVLAYTYDEGEERQRGKITHAPSPSPCSDPPLQPCLPRTHTIS